MPIRDVMTDKLIQQFHPSFLEVIDESELHHGHSGWKEGGETHFRVRIAASHFDDLSRVAQHRAVMETLDDEIKAGVHALAIEIVGPDGPVKAANPT